MTDFAPLIILVLVVLAIIFRPRKKTSSVTSISMPSPAHYWDDSKLFDFQVVGESHYQEALAATVRALAPNRKVIATLIPDNSNAHDDQAVRVELYGQHVGYLGRDDARGFRQRLTAKKLSGQITSCEAEIRGGGKKRNGEEMLYGVFLRLKQVS